MKSTASKPRTLSSMVSLTMTSSMPAPSVSRCARNARQGFSDAGGIWSRNTISPAPATSTATFLTVEQAGTLLPFSLIFEPHTACGQTSQVADCGVPALIEGPTPLSDQQIGAATSFLL